MEIVNKMKKNMNMWYESYKMYDWFTFKDLQHQLAYEESDFEKFRSSAFHYGVMSEKDYDETSLIAMNYSNELINKVIYNY